MEVRPADVRDIEELVNIWYEGWHDAHAKIVPTELVALRSRDNFLQRLTASLSTVRVAGSPGAPVGFYIVRGSELEQFYVAPQVRGRGVAAVLIADAEARMSAGGVDTTWLSCAIGNDRAARFYEKSGWRRVGIMIDEVETWQGPFPLKVWRYEKVLIAPA